jgi:hypothetical protein
VPTYRRATVTGLLAERAGLQRVDTTAGRAYVLTQLTPAVAVGDEVVLNTTAVELGLGTGGWHVVHWNLSVDEWSEPGPGHIVKLRYTSLQVDTGAAEEGRPEVERGLEGAPVVACTLHSQVAVVAAVARLLAPSIHIAYVMTDGAALPLALSDIVDDLRRAGAIDSTVTAGHAFGGDLEAVSVPSALALARHVGGADLIVAGMGPGVVGTASALGTTAVEAAAVLDTAAALGGRPVLCPRVSEGDARDRHRGTSHHTTTVLDLVRSEVDVPQRRPDDPDAADALGRLGVRVTTMGRGPADDPAFFAACSATAAHAVRLLAAGVS